MYCGKFYDTETESWKVICEMFLVLLLEIFDRSTLKPFAKSYLLFVFFETIAFSTFSIDCQLPVTENTTNTAQQQSTEFLCTWCLNKNGSLCLHS